MNQDMLLLGNGTSAKICSPLPYRHRPCQFDQHFGAQDPWWNLLDVQFCWVFTSTMMHYMWHVKLGPCLQALPLQEVGIPAWQWLRQASMEEHGLVRFCF